LYFTYLVKLNTLYIKQVDETAMLPLGSVHHLDIVVTQTAAAESM